MNFSIGNRVGRSIARQLTIGSTSSLVTGRQSSSDDSWDPLDLSSTEYARMRRELMQLINSLRSMGAETMIDLPSIVVIGGQSAGKSSLVEAVSGVSVPRDSGTCTRCPMECTMSSDAKDWSCTIKLRFDYDSSGNSASQHREVVFGPPITDKSEVDIWLRRAQAAILNPDLSPGSFHKKNAHELKTFSSNKSLKFSRNVVSIFIEDPSATDLSFVDLPGLIQNEDQEVLDLVRKLTESYISRPNTIILTTIPMSDDIQNQQSVKLAREADPGGERTIGVLTKPDMLGDGAVNAKKLWLDVIEGRQHVLKHGYYCVRLPDDSQRAQRLSRSELQRTAAEYFDKTAPWRDVTDRGRFGIPAFVSDISVLLVSHIRKAIPQLKKDVERLFDSCLKELSALPKPLETDPQIEVLARVNAFCDAFKGVVSGASSDKTLAQRNRAIYTIFGKEVRGTAPDFRPFEKPAEYLPIDVLDSEESTIVKDNRVKMMGVLEVRKTIKESISWELPGNIPYEAKARLIKQFTTLWSEPTEKCLTSIYDVLDDVSDILVKEHFGRFQVLQNLISVLIRPDIEEHKAKALVAVKETLRLELIPIYTQNERDFNSLRESWRIKYRKARQKPGEYRIPESPSESVLAYRESIPMAASPAGRARETVPPEIQALNYLAQAGYRGLTVDDLARLCPDQYDDELTVMADVRAYFTIAYKRIIDHVPLKIEQTLHQALAESLSVGLLRRLIVDTTSTGDFADRMKELVSEDPAIEAKRAELESKKNRLQDMKRKLAKF